MKLYTEYFINNYKQLILCSESTVLPQIPNLMKKSNVFVTIIAHQLIMYVKRVVFLRMEIRVLVHFIKWRVAALPILVQDIY